MLGQCVQSSYPLLMIFPIHVQLRTQRFWIIEGSSFDTHQLRPYRQFSSNGRSTFAAEMSIRRLSTVPDTLVRLESVSFYRHIRFFDANHNRKRRPRGLLTRPTVAHRRKERLGTTSVSQRSTQTRTRNLLHRYSPCTEDRFPFFEAYPGGPPVFQALHNRLDYAACRYR